METARVRGTRAGWGNAYLAWRGWPDGVDAAPGIMQAKEKGLTDTSDSLDESSVTALGEAIEAAAGTIGAARVNASRSAKIAAGKVQSGISTGSYSAAYGLSFGVVFTAVFLKEFLPEGSAVRRGLEDGAEAAFDAVAARRHAAEEAEPPETSPGSPAKPAAKRATKRVVRSAAG